MIEELPGFLRAANAAADTVEASAPRASIQPAEVIRLPEFGGDDADRREAAERGHEALRQGRVAVVVVAGGQGTRLGFPGPKGSYPIGPLSQRSLFEIQAQKIRRLVTRFGKRIPWYVMTSPATHEATLAEFAARDYFGLPESDVFFFRQGLLPAIDFQRRLILEAPHRISENPSGHGGCIPALAESGALADMRNRGVETVFYYQVDNPLIRIAHPEFLGFHLAARAEMSCKVLRKPDPDVRWGVFARMGGRLAIVEYTELDEGMRHARDSSGELVYWAGSPAIHLFEVEFLERVAARANALLPLHASAKKLARVDELGQPLHSPAPNGYKLERFVFDALPAASRAILLEVRASEEFSPVKNAEGSESPASARRDLQREYWRWLSEGGVELPSGAGEQQSAESSDECIDPQIGLQIELNHAAVDGPDDVVALGWRSLDEAQLAALIKPGKQA